MGQIVLGGGSRVYRRNTGLSLCQIAIFIIVIFGFGKCSTGDSIPADFAGPEPFETIESVRKTSLAMRELVTDCVPLSLAFILNCNKVDVNYIEIRQAFQTKSDKGVRPEEVAVVASRYGVAVESFKVPFERLSEVTIPAIILLNNNEHAVVLTGKNKNNGFTVWDPSGLKFVDIPSEILQRKFGGVAFVVSKPLNFDSISIVLLLLIGVGVFRLLYRIEKDFKVV